MGVDQKYNVYVNNPPEVVETRLKLGAMSGSSFNSQGGKILEESDQRLRFPNSSLVYKKMSTNSDLSAAIGLIETIISRAVWRVKAPKEAPEIFKSQADKLSYNMLVMDRPFSEYIGEITSGSLIYGFSPVEKIYKEQNTPLGKFIGWKDLKPISQDTVKEWVRDKYGDIVGLNQDLTVIRDSGFFKTEATSYSTLTIPRKKFILFRHNPRRNNPEGTSALRGGYMNWKYLELIQEFEAIYTTKGLGGILDLGVDIEYLNKALIDPAGKESLVVEQLKSQAASFHNGDQAYVITPLAYNDKGGALFHTKILETKPPDTDEIIKRHSHRLLQCFFSDILQLGSDGSGSFALSDSKQSMVELFADHVLSSIKNTLNHDLIPQTYKLNGWDYDARYCARFEVDSLNDGDLDVLSKAIQRCVAVGLIRKTEDIETFLRDKLMDLPPVDETTTELLPVEETETTSRSGEGFTKGSDNGLSDKPSTRDNSIANLEN